MKQSVRNIESEPLLRTTVLHPRISYSAIFENKNVFLLIHYLTAKFIFH